MKGKEIPCLDEAVAAFFKTMPTSVIPYGNGHINDTFLVECEKRYILQKMNTNVFPRPVELMDNIIGVTTHIRNVLLKKGKDAERGTLSVLPTLVGEMYFVDSRGGYWRLYKFIEKSVTFEKVACREDFYRCGKSFGEFCQLLGDYPAKDLNCPVENLHNTPWRYEKFLEAVDKDIAKKVKNASEEIEFVKSRCELSYILENAHREGKLPLRVTHNDTKLNNILFDEETLEPVCVIDLDTVMPGFSVTDFGDSIRYGANTALEDEKDLSCVGLDIELFEAYAKGFIQGSGNGLTKDEITLLPYGAIVITYECGMRFLTDYLNGDVYFKIHRPDHNLERARCQFALLRDMEKKKEKMIKIIESI